MNEAKDDTPAAVLCKACGLCCTGHLFIWAKLRPAELDPAEALGLQVFRTDPTQRWFSQPCPLWHGECTIYNSRHYPHVCRAYKCRLLKDVLAERRSLPSALERVTEFNRRIADVEARLPPSALHNFRERLAAFLEHPEAVSMPSQAASDLRRLALSLLESYASDFGVTDVVETSSKVLDGLD